MKFCATTTTCRGRTTTVTTSIASRTRAQNKGKLCPEPCLRSRFFPIFGAFLSRNLNGARYRSGHFIKYSLLSTWVVGCGLRCVNVWVFVFVCVPNYFKLRCGPSADWNINCRRHIDVYVINFNGCTFPPLPATSDLIPEKFPLLLLCCCRVYSFIT